MCARGMVSPEGPPILLLFHNPKNRVKNLLIKIKSMAKTKTANMTGSIPPINSKASALDDA